jgi:hypothetical protein
MVPMARSTLLTIATPIFLAACATQPQQKTQENEAVRKRAAHEIARICALPEADRQAEIDKIKQESGVAIYCP